MTKLPDSFETERLYIRIPNPGDSVDVYEAIHESREALRTWMGWAQYDYTRKEADNYIRQAIQRFRNLHELHLLLFRKSDDVMVGSSSIHSINWEVPRFEIGYWVRTSCQGNGYITEAVRGLTTFAFDQLNAVRVEIRCDVNNQRSAAVAERAGYTLEARLRHHRRDMHGRLSDTLIYVRFPDSQ
ncbi:MAG: GNAT family N-acetyltransferase [Anaerolineae bacterium]|nr:GNAT family N-acetyltransferase [Anaerolineae bacterium]